MGREVGNHENKQSNSDSGDYYNNTTLDNTGLGSH